MSPQRRLYMTCAGTALLAALLVLALLGSAGRRASVHAPSRVELDEAPSAGAEWARTGK